VTEKGKKRLKGTAIYLLLCIGTGLLLSPLAESAVMRTVRNRYLFSSYTKEEIAENIEEAQAAVVEEDITVPDLAGILEHVSDVERGDVIGVVAIASIGLYQPILNGMTKASLLAGAGTFQSGQMMGKGNYCLAGHHMKDESLLFGPLLQTNLGDWIQLTDKQNLYTYEVTSIEVVHQSDTEVLEDTETPTVTLITCDRTGVNTNFRLVVKGTLLDVSQVEGSEEENQYLELYKYQETNNKKSGGYLIWVWILGISGLAAVLLWIGKRMLRRNDRDDEESEDLQ